MEYVNTVEPIITEDDLTHDNGCERLRSGLYARMDCCDHCRALIASSRPREYRVRDSNGHIITADWVF